MEEGGRRERGEGAEEGAGRRRGRRKLGGGQGSGNEGWLVGSGKGEG
jgi:hypothetical protein